MVVIRIINGRWRSWGSSPCRVYQRTDKNGLVYSGIAASQTIAMYSFALEVSERLAHAVELLLNVYLILLLLWNRLLCLYRLLNRQLVDHWGWIHKSLIFVRIRVSCEVDLRNSLNGSILQQLRPSLTGLRYAQVAGSTYRHSPKRRLP